MYTNTQKLAAEFLGTFALVFFGEGALCADQFLHGTGNIGLIGVALAHGFALAIMISALGHISGGHFNPAVTIGYWVTKRTNTFDVILYWVAQLAGAIAAAFLLKAIIPDDTWRAVALGTPEFARDFPRWAGLAMEATGTFFIVLVMFATSVDDRGTSRAISGFGVGLVYALGIIVAGPFTGGALNPARAFGPALAATHWANQGVFWVGPLAGGFAAALLYDTLYLKRLEV
jgi:MIP family channel proteins